MQSLAAGTPSMLTTSTRRAPTPVTCTNARKLHQPCQATSMLKEEQGVTANVGCGLAQCVLTQVATLADEQLESMGARRICSRGAGDEDMGKMAQQFDDWSKGLLQSLQHGSAMPDHAEAAEADAQSDG